MQQEEINIMAKFGQYLAVKFHPEVKVLGTHHKIQGTEMQTEQKLAPFCTIWSSDKSYHIYKQIN